jgi:Putative MetA-pathway of phenol degradation
VPAGARAALAAILLASAAAPALGQTRPLLTEEATTAAGGSIVLEGGWDAIHAERNFLTGEDRDRVDAPVLRMVFSPAANVEIDLEWVGRVIAVDDSVFGEEADWGDVTLRAKTRLWGAAGGGSALAVQFGLTLPQTSFGNGLGPNTMRMSAQLLATGALGRVSIHGNVGLGLDDEPLRPHEQRDFFVYGLALTAGLGRGVALVAEVAGRAGNGAPGAEEHSEARLGVRLGAGRLRADGAVRRGLAPADGTWGATAGFSWQIRAGR